MKGLKEGDCVGSSLRIDINTLQVHSSILGFIWTPSTQLRFSLGKNLVHNGEPVSDSSVAVISPPLIVIDNNY
jgi:hypothetical protein